MDLHISESATGTWWFKEGRGQVARDSCSAGRDLVLHGRADWGNFDGIVLDGSTAYLETAQPVLDTARSYSVAVWVRLDGATMQKGLSMDPDEFAWTAASQDSPTHSPFYLGVRRHPDDRDNPTLCFNITMAPVDGSVTGTLEWRHAYGVPITEDMIGRWFLLVGTVDVPLRQLRLHVPELTSGFSQAPEEWPFWGAEGGLQVGRARWLGNPVDYWPGSIGPVFCFNRVLSEADAAELAAKTSPC